MEVRLRAQSLDIAYRVDVSLDKVAPEAGVCPQRPLEIDGPPLFDCPQGGHAHRLGTDVRVNFPRSRDDDGQADAVDGDRVAGRDLAGQPRRDAQRCPVRPDLDDFYRPHVLDQPREHVTTPSTWS